MAQLSDSEWQRANAEARARERREREVRYLLVMAAMRHRSSGIRFENMDLVGLDLVHTIHQYLLADLSDHRQPLELLEQHVRADECGMKSGRGFYNWQTRSPGELLERRNQQIVQQLKFLKEINAL